MLSDAELAAIRERAEAATPGPWETRHRDHPHSIQGIYGGDYPVADARPYPKGEMGVESGLQRTYNARFICAAREDIPALLAHIDAQAARIAELEQAVERKKRHAESLIWELGAEWEKDSKAKDAIIEAQAARIAELEAALTQHEVYKRCVRQLVTSEEDLRRMELEMKAGAE